MLWLVLVPMALLAAAGVAAPFLRAAPQARIAAPGEGLAERLADIDRQAADGELTPAEAQALALEARRRLLAESRDTSRPARPVAERTARILAGVCAALVFGGGLGLYGWLGRPDMAQREVVTAAASGEGIDGVIAALEAEIRAEPDDVERLRILGLAYAEAGRFEDAAQAFGHALSLAPDDARLASARGEALVQAAGGRVTEPARQAFVAALALEPADARARYFVAFYKDQNDDRDGAMDDWIALLNTAPPGASWAPQVRAFVEQVAQERGVDISDRLPAPLTGDARAAPGS